MSSNSTHSKNQTEYQRPQSANFSKPFLDYASRPDPTQQGHIPGVVPGTTWRSRAEISQAGVHGGYQSGISASKNDQGAASIVMNGFYANSDGGDLVWYIGAGGKHLGGKDYKKMIKNQTINTSYNKAMCQSLITGQPVRLVRGSKMKKNSPWAPDEGFRYDGLYVVTRSDQVPDPSQETAYECLEWRLERIKNLDEDKYEIPVRPDLEDKAEQLASQAMSRKLNEDALDEKKGNTIKAQFQHLTRLSKDSYYATCTTSAAVRDEERKILKSKTINEQPRSPDIASSHNKTFWPASKSQLYGLSFSQLNGLAFKRTKNSDISELGVRTRDEACQLNSPQSDSQELNSPPALPSTTECTRIHFPPTNSHAAQSVPSRMSPQTQNLSIGEGEKSLLPSDRALRPSWTTIEATPRPSSNPAYARLSPLCTSNRHLPSLKTSVRNVSTSNSSNQSIFPSDHSLSDFDKNLTRCDSSTATRTPKSSSQLGILKSGPWSPPKISNEWDTSNKPTTSAQLSFESNKINCTYTATSPPALASGSGFIPRTNSLSSPTTKFGNKLGVENGDSLLYQAERALRQIESAPSLDKAFSSKLKSEPLHQKKESLPLTEESCLEIKSHSLREEFVKQIKNTSCEMSMTNEVKKEESHGDSCHLVMTDALKQGRETKIFDLFTHIKFKRVSDLVKDEFDGYTIDYDHSSNKYTVGGFELRDEEDDIDGYTMDEEDLDGAAMDGVEYYDNQNTLEDEDMKPFKVDVEDVKPCELEEDEAFLDFSAMR